MNNKELLSIIVPVYNANSYLDKTLKSVLSQSYRDYELIFVNDGSNDGSLETLLRFKLSDSRIKVYSQKNKGVTSARKLGWLNSKGTYIVFLDADDSFCANSLKVLMENALEGDFDIVNGSFKSIPSGRFWENKPTGILSKYDYLNSLLFGKTFGVLYASVYKKEIFKESTFSFDSSISVGEDVLMNLELCKRALNIKNIKDLVYNYTDDNDGSAMNITIRHPSYYFRYNKIRDRLIKEIDKEFYYSIKDTISVIDNRVIVRSFFSPFIPYDEGYYHKINKMLGYCGDKFNLQYFLRNKILAKTAKVVINFFHSIRELRFTKDKSNRKIIY
ncbi:glycosyltransferase [Cyclobacterium sp. 1_MG-2023]|uniref:glycosyltransferase family 2 protein n=1 Tax=Cyclobacterium sp. 1_MG-2023 TaxID=3062681 RepID=UPI0026E40B7B|nr:glycosyltransferase [Cyclobacterium sp. 1_MG-2023]MDO6440386.1 glycosyltransferase [Cyclobacterium sp. 1_MG-2023]